VNINGFDLWKLLQWATTAASAAEASSNLRNQLRTRVLPGVLAWTLGTIGDICFGKAELPESLQGGSFLLQLFDLAAKTFEAAWNQDSISTTHSECGI